MLTPIHHPSTNSQPQALPVNPHRTLSVVPVTDYAAMAQMAQQWSVLAQKKLSQSPHVPVSPVGREFLAVYIGALDFARRCGSRPSGLYTCQDAAGQIHGLLQQNAREIAVIPNPIDIDCKTNASEPGRVADIMSKLQKLSITLQGQNISKL